MDIRDDVNLYSEIVKKISAFERGEGIEFHKDRYEKFISLFCKFIRIDFFTASLIEKARIEIIELLLGIPGYIVPKAFAVFKERNSARGGSWKDVGMVGAFIEIHAKLSRLRYESTDEDSLVDLFNYLVIALMCIDENRIIAGHRSKTVVITGDQQGLGKGMADLFRANGYNVVDFGTRITKDQIDDFFSTSAPTRIDYFINNYGINHLNWLGELTDADYNIVDINVKNYIRTIDWLVRLGNVCRILNISSQTYKIPQRCTSVYCSSKAAISHFTKVAARELAPRGFVVNALAPGKIIGTEMTKLTDAQVLKLRSWNQKKADKYALSLIPSGRFTTVEEVALAAIKILHLPEYINGVTIDMTGGL